MDNRLKHRLVGTAVIVALAVIFLPELLRPAVNREPLVKDMELPPRPVHTFEPTSDKPPVEAPTPESAPAPTVVPQSAVRPNNEPEILADSAPTAPQPKPAGNKDLASNEDAAPGANNNGLPELSPDLQAWVVQVGSFAEKRNAESLRDKLRESDFSAFVEPAEVGDRRMYRVRVGPELEKRMAERLKVDLQKQLQIAGQIRRYP